VDAEFLALQAEKTHIIRQHILGAESDAKARLADCGEREIAFYEERGKLPDYAVLNGL
jgi:hypothetical protein